MISFVHKGNYDNTERLLKKISEARYIHVLEKCAQEGVSALAAATPVDTGRTAASWSYEIVKDGSGYSIFWTNDNINKNVNIAIILQYGHGTGTGGYVQGRDYINPAITPIFDRMAEELWKEVMA